MKYILLFGALLKHWNLHAGSLSIYLVLTGGKGAVGGESSYTGAQPKATKGKKDNAPEKKGGAQAPEKKISTDKEKEKKKDVPAPRLQFDDEQRVAKAKRRSLVVQTETKNRVELFRHLPQFVHGTQLPSLEAKFFQDDASHPHPAVYQVHHLSSQSCLICFEQFP